MKIIFKVQEYDCCKLIYILPNIRYNGVNKKEQFMKNNQKKQTHTMTLITILILALAALGMAGLALFIDNQPEKPISESGVEGSALEEASQLEGSQEQTRLDPPKDIDEALENFSYDHPESFAHLKEMSRNLYGEDFLGNQDEIIKTLKDNDMFIINFGYAFLPDHPAPYTEVAASARQIDSPLMLQSDPQWSRVPYGTTEEDTMRLGGCALVSLAMVEATFGDPSTDPLDILDWSGNDYWVGDDGTSWMIFEDFAKEYGYNFENHGNDLEAALEDIHQGKLVIASVNPGYITDVGHILVIRGHDPENALVYVNDPNDNPYTMYSIQGLPEYYFWEDAINYWSFIK